MFGFSMTKMIRAHSNKLDKNLRDSMLHLYRPFKWTPCFLHKFLEGMIKSSKKLSVIVEVDKGCYDEAYTEMDDVLRKHFRCKMKKQFKTISCCSMEVTPKAMEGMLSCCKHIKKIHLNREVKALLDVAVPSANAHQIIRNDTHLTGKGVTIAVIDTGVYEHEDLEGRVIASADFINGRAEAYDDNGHGTHCAGDAAGNGAASGGDYKGPAPEANIVAVKVLNKLGAGSLETVMEGIEWCMEYNNSNPDHPINIINLSLGSTAIQYDKEREDPMVRMVEAAWKSGIVVCAAAGNEGPEAGTIASPGVSRRIITVGALDDRNTVDRSDADVASFSSRGPTVYGKTKPDILAPGVEIVSLTSPGSYLDKLQKNNRVAGSYIALSGTSMATPICAGIVALMLEHNPSLSPDKVKKRLMNGADLWRDRDENIYGAGYINGEKAVY